MNSLLININAKIPYEGGSTQSFFRESNFSIYAKMWSRMESTKPSPFVTSNAQGKVVTYNTNRLTISLSSLTIKCKTLLGIDRVKDGGCAFLMESPSIEYVIERECELYQIGGLLDSKGMHFHVSDSNHSLNYQVTEWLYNKDPRYERL